jgi:hypothetical protein
MVDMRSVAPEEDALLDVTRRLTRQIEQQLAQLRRMREHARPDGSVSDATLGELEHLTRRMRRDGERLGLLCGAQQVAAGARSVADVLNDAAGAAAEPVRVTVRPAPIATVAGRAAVELMYVLTEILDAALAECALGITLGGRLGPAGLTVDVTLDGPLRGRGLDVGRVAEALARRSSAGVHVHRADADADGAYAIVLCPAASLTVPVQRRPATADVTGLAPSRPESHRPDPLNDPLPSLDPLSAPMLSAPMPPAPVPADALGARSFGEPAGAGMPRRPRGERERDMFGVRSEGSDGGSALFGGPQASGRGPQADTRGGNLGGAAGGPGRVNGSGSGGGSAHGLGGGVNGIGTGQPARPPAASYGRGTRPDLLPSGVEALFGPLPSSPEGPISTPIYEAVASAWFRDDGTTPADWESPGDAEWRAAAARAAEHPETAGTTASGLPRRRPGQQMVTPPLQRAAAGAREGRVSEDRAPDRVRERLDGYQRGLRQGRHRATESEPPAGRATRWA